MYIFYLKLYIRKYKNSLILYILKYKFAAKILLFFELCKQIDEKNAIGGFCGGIGGVFRR